MAQVETVELVRKDYPRAIHLYQGLLGSSGADVQPLILHRLARTFRKAGRPDDAVREYQELERLAPNDLGPLPWSLIARSELCSIAAERGSAGELAAREYRFAPLDTSVWLRGVVDAFQSEVAGRKPRVLADCGNDEWMQTYDWSPDGKQILIFLEKKDATRHIVVVSATDGTTRVVKTFEKRGRFPHLISPLRWTADGKYILFTRLHSAKDNCGPHCGGSQRMVGSPKNSAWLWPALRL